jgi:hypothetical protein
MTITIYYASAFTTRKAKPKSNYTHVVATVLLERAGKITNLSVKAVSEV